jgi:hypothetical protein
MSGYTPKYLFGDILPISDGVYTLREYAINIDEKKTNKLNTQTSHIDLAYAP